MNANSVTIRLPGTEGFSPLSRVWVYHASRPFTEEEMEWVPEAIKQFAAQWTAHNKQLHATGGILAHRFLVLVADETHTSASGCSIDTSVHFIRDLGQKTGIDLLGRTLLSYFSGEEMHTVSLDVAEEMIRAGSLDGDTPVFNTTVQNLEALETKFLIPLRESWLKNRLPS